MALQDIVSVNITKSTRYPSRKGFGIPMIVVFHSFWTAVCRRFRNVSELAAAGVPTTHVMYRMAQAIFAQNPSVGGFVVGKRSSFTQVFKFKPRNNVEGFVYNLTVVRPTGVKVAVTHTVTTGQTLTQIATALAASIDAVAEVTAASVADEITATSTAGSFVAYEGLPEIEDFSVEDATANTNDIATDLEAIAIASGKNSAVLSFYGFAVDQPGRLTLESAAAWAETQKVEFFTRTSDSECADPGVTDDVGSTLKGLNYARTATIFAQPSTADFCDAAAMGRHLPTEPGEATLHMKELTGVLPSTLSTEEEATLRSKNLNTYTTINNLEVVSGGVTASGEYVDVTRDLDFVHARLQEDVFGYIASQKKVPFTQSGIDSIIGVAQARLNRCTEDPNHIFTEDDPPVVEALAVEDTEASDRASRTLRTIEFRAKLAGAIHTVEISGTVTV